MITATWLGGPRDGQQLALQDDYPIRFYERVGPVYIEPETHESIGLDTYEAPVRQRASGRWFIVYTERRKL